MKATFSGPMDTHCFGRIDGGHESPGLMERRVLRSEFFVDCEDLESAFIEPGM